MVEIDAVTAKPAFGQDCRDLRRILACTKGIGIDNHARQPRRQRQRAQALALSRDAAVGIERAEFFQQAPGFLQSRRRRRIEKGERRGIADAPLREIEHQRRKIGREDFRLGIGGERRRLRLVPQPVADAGLGAAGAAAALVDRRARGAYGLQPRQSDIGLIAWHPRHAGIHYDADTLDGQRGLSDGGR